MITACCEDKSETAGPKEDGRALTHNVAMLRSVPEELHDCNSKSKCCNAETERVELDIHGVRSTSVDSDFPCLKSAIEQCCCLGVLQVELLLTLLEGYKRTT